MLRACHRVLRPGGRLAFFTITASPGLSADARRRALIAGPPEIGERRDHRTMLASSGFDEISETDVTADFLDIARRWLVARERRAEDLKRALGEDEFVRGQTESRATIAAIDQGLLRRSLFVSRRP